MADFIDREAVLTEIYQYTRHYWPTVSYVESIIQKQPAADVEPVKRWIPCSERLPGNGEDVLCWYEYFRFGEYNRMFRTFGIGYQYNGFWGGEVSIGRDAKVLAWMPLPEPPKMDGGADHEM